MNTLQFVVVRVSKTIAHSLGNAAAVETKRETLIKVPRGNGA